MNYQTLMGSNCGENNPISQLVQHVTDDQGFQERIGHSYTAGLNQNNLMHPQSFRMNDIMRELGQIEPSPSHIDLQTHSSFSTTSTTEYQNQMQYDFQVRNEQIWNKNNLHNYANETNYSALQGFIDGLSSPLYGLPESQNFIQNKNQLISQFEAKSQESKERLADLEGGIRIENLEELKHLNQHEDNSINSQKVQNEQLPELLPETANSKNERISIPEWTNPTQYFDIMSTCLSEYRKEKLHPDFQKRTRVTTKGLLNPGVYAHFENNPVRDEVNLFEKGAEAYRNDCYIKAALYFDEIVRRNEATPSIWYKLGYSLYANHQDEMAIPAIKHHLRLQPDSFRGIQLLWCIYNKYGCKYQACQTVLYWFRNNKFYNHLIPPDFTMDDQDSHELEENLLDSVKNLLLKAVREDTEYIDEGLQIMIGNLFAISKDYDKVADCKLAAIHFSEQLSGRDLCNMGLALFRSEKPNEALEAFFEAAAVDRGETYPYRAIGYVYTYLKNYREAIRYFKKGLSPEILNEESKFELNENTLEDEYELCVRLYCEISTK